MDPHAAVHKPDWWGGSIFVGKLFVGDYPSKTNLVIKF